MRTLRFGNGVSGREALDDEGPVLLLQRGIAGVALARPRHSEAVAPARSPAARMRLDLLAHIPARATRIAELHRSTEIFLSLLRLLQVVVPETPELFVHLRQLAHGSRGSAGRPTPSALARRSSSATSALKSRLVPIELREAIGGDLRCVGSRSMACISTRAARCASPSVVDQTLAASLSQCDA